MTSTILAVEDDPIVQDLVKTALGKAGYGVVLAGSGREMFETLKGGEAVDLVLLDLGLPDGDAMPHIMELREKTDLPIVVLTARGRQDDRLMALGLGADDYMTKPIDVRELVLRVGNILARNRGEPRPSVAGLVGETSRATPMPSGRRPQKTKIRIGLGAVVGGLVLAGIVGAGVYLGMKSGIHETPIRKQTASVAPQPEPQSVPQAESQAANGESEPDLPVNVAPPTAGDKTTVTVSESASGQDEPMPEPATELAPEPQSATAETAAETQTDRTRSTATIVTLPAPGPDDRAADREASAVDTAASADAPPPRAVVLGYGWVLDTKCPPLPDVEWWSQRSHEEMAHYVTRRKDGDWDFYIAGLAEQLSTLYDISARGSAAKTRTGERLEGDDLKAYIDLAVKRIEIARCLAAEAAAAKTAGQ